MRNEHTTAEDRLAHISVEHLSEEERGRLWRSVTVAHARIPRVTPSPYSGWVISRFTHSHSMITAAIALMLALSAGATVIAADDSRPGDVLFPIDRAAENVRVALARNDKKDELRIRFANERAMEVESIIDEEGERVRLSTTARAKFSGNAALEAALMAVSSDDSGDTPDDSDSRKDSEDDIKGGERIANGLSVAVGYLTKVSAELEAKGNVQAKESVDAVIARLNSKIGEIPEGLRLRLKLDSENTDNNLRIRVRTEEEGDGNGKTEVRRDGVRTRVEFKNGEIRIESKKDDDSRDGFSTNRSGLEIEADVFTDRTIVQVERNGTKELFVTSAKTRADVVAAIATKLNLSIADVDAVLDFEIENRASRQDDLPLSGSSGGSKDDIDDDSRVRSGGKQSGGLLGVLLGDDSDDDDDDDDDDEDDD